MSGANKIKKRELKDKISLKLIIFLFSIISFYTSYTGFLKLAGVLEHDYILKTFMGILVGTLQFALVFSINSLYFKDFFKKDWIKTVALLLMYIITMTLSVTFSFSYWYKEFSAENYAERNSQIQLNRVKDNLTNAKESFIVMSNSLVNLSKYSATKSNQERVYGRTCDPKVGSGEGVYTWLRADDAKYTKHYSEDIKKLIDRLDSEIRQVSLYLETFDPKGDVVKFNRRVNNRIQQINIRFFNNPILKDLESMLIARSGSNRQYIHVINRRTGATSIESCMDRDFTIGANRVLSNLRALKPIERVTFFDMSDTKELLARTVRVLKALITRDIKDSNDKTISPTDITNDDMYAVSTGFVIDFLILLVTLIAKEPKEDLVPIEVVEDILNGKYADKILSSIKLFIAELDNSYLLAVPNNIDDKTIDNLRLLVLYMQQHKLANLYINEIKANRLNRYFSKRLQERYPNSIFKIYKIDKNRFNHSILQEIMAGVYHV